MFVIGVDAKNEQTMTLTVVIEQYKTWESALIALGILGGVFVIVCPILGLCLWLKARREKKLREAIKARGIQAQQDQKAKAERDIRVQATIA